MRKTFVLERDDKWPPTGFNVGTNPVSGVYK